MFRMGIFVKTLTGHTITLEVGTEIQIGPRRQDGTFLIRTPKGEVWAVEAYLEISGWLIPTTRVDLSPL